MNAPNEPMPDRRTDAVRSRLGAPLTVAGLALAMGVELVSNGAEQAIVSGVQQDSRQVAAGDLFVALRGASVDATRFIPAAVERGAVALLIDSAARETIDCTLPLLLADRPRAALAKAAALVYGRPTDALRVVGLTGTNGKTTTATMLGACLDACGASTLVIGTLGFRFAGALTPSRFTSPEADELQRVAAQMLARGADHLVMEVSSIALVAQRVAEVSFDVAVFTNLTQDHLDFHGDMASYAAAKDELFFVHQPRIAVVNVDDPHGAELARRLSERGGVDLWRTSLDPTADAEVKALSFKCGIGGIDMRVASAAGEFSVTSPMLGAHNASNLLSALAAALSLGFDGSAVVAALGKVSSVDGRLERVDDPAVDEVVVLVDYAHTPDALARTLSGLRELGAVRLSCVFGCGGDRDRDKRQPMGRIVAELADLAIVTNDNPRSEPPQTIAAAILEGVAQVPNARYQVELDRARAIQMAIDGAGKGDIVLVAGKGHEPYQIIGDKVLAFDDRQVARTALIRRRERLAAAGSGEVS